MDGTPAIASRRSVSTEGSVPTNAGGRPADASLACHDLIAADPFFNDSMFVQNVKAIHFAESSSFNKKAWHRPGTPSSISAKAAFQGATLRSSMPGATFRWPSEPAVGTRSRTNDRST